MYVHPVVNPHFPDRYLNAFNESDNHNRIWQYDLALDKYGVKQSGYFILETTVSLGMGITDEKLLFYHGISEGSVDKQFSTIEYNNRKVYDCFNNLFPDDFGIPDLNLPPIIIDDRPNLDKRARYTPDLLPSDIYVVSKNSVSSLNTPSDSTQLLLLTSDDPNPPIP